MSSLQVLEQEEKVLIVEENTLQSQDQVDEGVQHILKVRNSAHPHFFVWISF